MSGLVEVLKEVRTGLEFYAAEESHIRMHEAADRFGRYTASDVSLDQGRRAKIALAEVDSLLQNLAVRPEAPAKQVGEVAGTYLDELDAAKAGQAFMQEIIDSQPRIPSEQITGYPGTAEYQIYWRHGKPIAAYFIARDDFNRSKLFLCKAPLLREGGAV